MTEAMPRYTGGCLCGALRYEAEGEPLYAGYCCCTDCRKASGSGFIPFIGVASEKFRLSGDALQTRSTSFRGSEAVRNRCAACGSLVFGGILGVDIWHTIYAGSLDEPDLFTPTMAIFTRDRPDWVILPEGIEAFETMPG